MAKRTAAADLVAVPVKADRTLTDWLGIAAEIAGLKETTYATAAADGKITAAEWLDLADQVLAVLDRHQVTIPELRAFLQSAGPLLGLLKIR